MVRERGIPERINRTALGAMMARGPLHDGIVLLLLLLLLLFAAWPFALTRWDRHSRT